MFQLGCLNQKLGELSLKRFEYLDNAKGIGILLLMLGHTSGLPILIYEVIFSFHVPLFFFISGYLMSDRMNELFFKSFLKVSKRLLLPLVFYFFLSYCLWLIREVLGIGSEEQPDSLLLPLYYFVTGNPHFSIVNSTLWYFLCFYNVVIMFLVAMRYLSSAFFILALSCFSIFILSYFKLLNIENRLIFNIDNALIALPFFCLGKIIRNNSFLNLQELFNNKCALLLIILIFIFLTTVNGKVDLNKLNFGSSLILYYLNSILGIFITINISINLQNIYIKKVLFWLSSNSIVIFPLHILIYSLITGGLLFSIGFSAKDHSGLLLSTFYIVTTLLALYFITSLWPSKIRFLLGK